MLKNSHERVKISEYVSENISKRLICLIESSIFPHWPIYPNDTVTLQNDICETDKQIIQHNDLQITQVLLYEKKS